MIVTINGEQREVAGGATLVSVFELLDVAPGARGVAVALNGEVVRRARWPETELQEGARVEVVAAIQGG